MKSKNQRGKSLNLFISKHSKKLILLALFLTIIGTLSYIYFTDRFNSSDLLGDISNKSESAEDVEGASIKVEESVLSNNICVDPLIDEDLTTLLQESITATYKVVLLNEEKCAVQIERFPKDVSEYNAEWQTVYVPVSRFDSDLKNIETGDLSRTIRIRSYEGLPIIWSSQDSQFFKEKFRTNFVQSFSSYQQLKEILKEDDGVIGIIPLNEVEPYMKVLKINSVTPMDPDLNIFTYPLSDFIWVKSNSSDTALNDQINLALSNWKPDNYFEEDQFSSVILGGRSLVGASVYYDKFEEDQSFDPLSPVRSIFDKADIVNISVDNTFAQNCTQTPNTTLLCGSPSSVNWLKGMNISLVGESIMDFGRDEFKRSLDIFKENGVEFYGGGLDRSSALTPYTATLKNRTISINSFSRVTPTRYLAGANFSGNLSPDGTNGDGKILSDYLKARDSNHFNIVELQLYDDTLTLDPNDSRNNASTYADLAIRNGADLVYFTYQHQPSGISFKDGAIVFWGLGDLVYKDISRDSEGIVVINHFYKGKYFTFEIIPVIVGDDLRVRAAEVDKEAEILNTVFSNSSIDDF